MSSVVSSSALHTTRTECSQFIYSKCNKLLPDAILTMETASNSTKISQTLTLKHHIRSCSELIMANNVTKVGRITFSSSIMTEEEIVYISTSSTIKITKLIPYTTLSQKWEGGQ